MLHEMEIVRCLRRTHAWDIIPLVLRIKQRDAFIAPDKYSGQIKSHILS